ncbi:DUF1552 domain-containing protein [Mariniblastus fucicola]|uniref:DUF1552 domain-containing protein n=1 Tax=Mariniblastus fucicola TaxID=980251 RepID=A0A5B9P9R5_9BACT|nr:DUF1552 domain-containing protein [Mariniblastus fucicola]QEG23068.1 hypothetical protein MFFC18_29600 [Mariniblastus fucicola]
MSKQLSRRDALKTLGYSAAMLPFVMPTLARAKTANTAAPIQRLIIMFSPNGTVQDQFWPETQGADFELKKILEPLAQFKESMLVTHGIHNKVRGDGDSHMRGMSCLLTGAELLPGNIQGGSHTPAGWAGGISIDQEIRNFLQSQESTKTRFGSLEFGVAVADRADPWTRMCYAAPNKPVAPDSNPYSMFEKMYGRGKNDALVRSVLDDIAGELKQFSKSLGSEEKVMLDEHVTYVRKMEQDLESAAAQMLDVAAPELPSGVSVSESNMPQIAKMQMDLLVNGFANDMNRVATLQYSNSVGGTRMKWLGFPEGHHQMSHDPDLKVESQEKLTKINHWYAEQLHYLVKQLAETKEPGSDRSLLDGTLIVWGNELGKGNSHTLDNIPFLMLGNAPGFKLGRYKDFGGVPHNRMLMSLAHAFGHNIETFGKPELCVDGPLTALNG